MVKLLMIQEEHFVKDRQGNVYSKRVLDDNILNRYLGYFDQLIIFARISDREFEEFSSLKKISDPRIKFYEMPDFYGPKQMILHSFKIIKTFKKAISDADIIFLRAPSMLTIFLYRFIPRRVKTGMEFMMGANYFIENESKIANFLNFLFDREAKRLARKVNGSLYVTKESLQREYPPNPQAFNKQNNSYFTYGVSDVVLNFKDFYIRPQIDDIKKKYTLISVGFMDSYRKGQDILIETVKILNDKGYDVDLKLIGDGKKKNEFENLAKKLEISNKVFFLGHISNYNEIREHLISSDIFVLPSKSEGLPRVIIEAFSLGLPVISSDVNGNYELVDSDFLVSEFNSKIYADQIMKLINNPRIYNDISISNLKKAEDFLPEKLDPIRNMFFEKLSKL